MSTVPVCPCCGSKNIEMPGFVPFRWSRGKWRPVIAAAEMACAEGAPLTCQDCGAKLAADLDPPFDLRLETTDKELGF